MMDTKREFRKFDIKIVFASKKVKGAVYMGSRTGLKLRRENTRDDKHTL